MLPEGIPKLRQKRYPIRLLIGSTAEEFSDTAFLVQPNGKVDAHRLLSVCREAVAEMAFRNTWQTTADCFIEYLNRSLYRLRFHRNCVISYPPSELINSSHILHISFHSFENEPAACYVCVVGIAGLLSGYGYTTAVVDG